LTSFLQELRDERLKRKGAAGSAAAKHGTVLQANPVDPRPSAQHPASSHMPKPPSIFNTALRK
jgi:hypothetical protein